MKKTLFQSHGGREAFAENLDLLIFGRLFCAGFQRFSALHDCEANKKITAFLFQLVYTVCRFD